MNVSKYLCFLKLINLNKNQLVFLRKFNSIEDPITKKIHKMM
jgi:hypothetical protein